VLTSVASELPIVADPLATKSGATFVEHAGHFWELAHWKQGAPQDGSLASKERLRAAFHAVAKFHQLAAHYERRRGAAPSIADRHERTEYMQHRGLAEIKSAMQSIAIGPLNDAARVLYQLAQHSLTDSKRPVHLPVAAKLWLQPVIRDIHREHVLFSGDEVSGLIDFGALRIDTPLADVARLIGSLAGDDVAARQFCIDCYSELAPLSQEDRGLIDLLDDSGLILSALNWLMWLYVERRDMGGDQPIIRRLQELTARLKLQVV
jgi:Ser/Thr protein kinase RdoA (MazF antagonist)